MAIDKTDLGPGVHRIVDLVEKPPREEAPSNLAIIGRYILTPDIFPALTGDGERSHRRDSADQRACGGCSKSARSMRARLPACGTTPATSSGFLKATAYFALKRPEFAEAFRRYLDTLDKPIGTPTR